MFSLTLSVCVVRFGLFVLGLLTFGTPAQTSSLPKLPGKHPVGITNLELVDYSRKDPFAPSSQPRDLMVSVFYPARDVHNYSVAQEFTPRRAAGLAALLGGGVSTESLISIRTQAHIGAPFNNIDPPVLLFSPGFDGSRFFYSGIAEALASKGFLTVTIDHPYETDVVEYPDGRVVGNVFKLTNDTIRARALETRRLDVSFIVDRLQNGSLTGLIPGFEGGLNVTQVGVLGHSFGGATAVAVLADDKRAACAADLDGGLAGPAVTQGTDRPFLLLRSSPHNRTNVPSWATYFSNLRGFQIDLTVDHTEHLSYTDSPAIRDALHLNNNQTISQLVGTIKSSRMQEIESAYLGAFFDMCLRGRNATLLSGPSKRFGDVHFNTE